MTSQSLKVLTYNIHKGFTTGKMRFVLHNMRSAIEEINPDLVFLQEVIGEHRKEEKRVEDWPDESQFEFLADELWPHHAYGKNAIYQAGHHGNAILSKYPFQFWDNINVAKHARASRSLLHGVIKIPEYQMPVHVICIHFGLFKNERQEQLLTLSNRIAEHVPENEPLIIAGDFNEWRKHAVDDLESALGLNEVFKELNGEYAKTFPALRPTLRIDRIYFRGLNLDHGVCHDKKPWKTMSDHLPLFAKFSLNQI